MSGWLRWSSGPAAASHRATDGPFALCIAAYTAGRFWIARSAHPSLPWPVAAPPWRVRSSRAVWSLTPDYGGSMAVPPDVLVVGAGPTGLALAAQLCAYGTRFRIVDRSLDRARKSRALAVQPRPGRPKSLPATHTIEAMSMAHRSDEQGQGQPTATRPGHWGLGRWAARRLRASE